MHASHALHARFRYDCFITVITIRNFDSLIKRSPQVRAAMNGRSMEAEVRAILTAIVRYVPTAEMPGPDPAEAEQDLGTVK